MKVNKLGQSAIIKNSIVKNHYRPLHKATLPKSDHKKPMKS